MAAARKLYNFYIDPELANGLKRLKQRTGAPEGELVRRAIAAYLAKAGVLKKKTERKRPAIRERS